MTKVESQQKVKNLFKFAATEVKNKWTNFRKNMLLAARESYGMQGLQKPTL